MLSDPYQDEESYYTEAVLALREVAPADFKRLVERVDNLQRALDDHLARNKEEL